MSEYVLRVRVRQCLRLCVGVCRNLRFALHRRLPLSVRALLLLHMLVLLLHLLLLHMLLLQMLVLMLQRAPRVRCCGCCACCSGWAFHKCIRRCNCGRICTREGTPIFCRCARATSAP